MLEELADKIVVERGLEDEDESVTEDSIEKEENEEEEEEEEEVNVEPSKEETVVTLFDVESCSVVVVISGIVLLVGVSKEGLIIEVDSNKVEETVAEELEEGMKVVDVLDVVDEEGVVDLVEETVGLEGVVELVAVEGLEKDVLVETVDDFSMPVELSSVKIFPPETAS